MDASSADTQRLPGGSRSRANFPGQAPYVLDRVLPLELVRATERAAMTAARMRGCGDGRLADQAAGDAMRHEIDLLPIDGMVVIAEGSRYGSVLSVGERLGNKRGPEVDVAVDPLEGPTLCAKNQPGAMAAMAIAEPGALLAVPDVYMQKVAIGPGYPKGILDLDAPAEELIAKLAAAKGVSVSAITALVLDRPRHADVIAALRRAGAAVRLVPDGDIAGVVETTQPDVTGIDVYMGVGGAPQGVFAAAALRCIGGQIQGRLLLDTNETRDRAAALGITDPQRTYGIEDMVRGDCIFAATGVTTGSMLEGVRLRDAVAYTETVVMRSATGTVRWIKAEHRAQGDEHP